MMRNPFKKIEPYLEVELRDKKGNQIAIRNVIGVNNGIKTFSICIKEQYKGEDRRIRIYKKSKYRFWGVTINEHYLRILNRKARKEYKKLRR